MTATATHSAPHADIVNQELNRLVNSDVVRAGSTQAKLLHYLVEQRLASNLSGLRELAIGIEVFGRSAKDYDPKSDPIVRVSVARLRERLQKHYALFDAPPALRIVLPKGHYVPDFVEPGTTELVAPRILVMPVGSSDAHVVADLLFEATIEALQGMAQIMVLGQRSARAASGDAPLDAAKRVNAQSVLTTELTQAQGCWRAHAMLTAAPFGQMMHSAKWSQDKGEAAFAFVARVADEIKEIALSTLTDQLAGQYMPPPKRRGLSDVSREAMAQFIEAKRASAEGTAEGHLKARQCLEEALKGSPHFAAAHAALAGVMGNLSMYEQVTPEEAWRVGSAASKRALELDPAEPNAYVNLAADKIYYEFDFTAARPLLIKALHLAPRFPGVHMLLGNLNAYEGLIEQSLTSFDAAYAVDPLFPATRANRVVALYFGQRFSEAIALGENLLEEFPKRSSTRLTLAEAYYHSGQIQKARQHVNQLLTNDADNEAAQLLRIVIDARESGKTAVVREIQAIERTKQLSVTNPSSFAYAYTQLGHLDRAVEKLTQAAAIREGGFSEAQVHPNLLPLHEHAGFVNLLAGFGLRPLHVRQIAP